MPSNTSLSTPVTPKKVLSVIHNIPKRMKSAQFQTPRRARGKENVPQGMQNPPPGTYAPTKGPNDDKWAPKDGMIIIKIWVPSTADIWKMKVPEDVALDDFLLLVERKVGFAVTFSAVMAGRLRTISSQTDFSNWMAQRIQYSRNHLLTAHRLCLQ